ncbi:MAG: HIT family protein [Methylobacteriaceae bacterium]|nr:HIT family protein [Methylobacteriaceae bacterium]
MSFDLDPHLAGDTLPLGDLLLSRVLLVNDSRFPWLMLVPRRPNMSEFTDLPPGERSILMEEIAAVSTALKETTHSAKLNVGAIGNVVPQLHVHVVARFEGDDAWPDPVWGHGDREPYQDQAAEAFKAEISQRLAFV